MPPDLVRSRAYKAARRFEIIGFNIVTIGHRLNFQRSDFPMLVAKALAMRIGASEVELRVSRGFGKESAIFKEHLFQQKSTRALVDEKTAINNFRRREWEIFLPALPILSALFLDILEYDPEAGDFQVKLPGHGRRYLALSLLMNPQQWIDKIAAQSQLRRFLMQPQFLDAPFAEVLGEDPMLDLNLR